MKIFDKAILKLTGIFAGILLLVSLGFSAVVYSTAFRETNVVRPPSRTIVFGEQRINVEQGMAQGIEQMISERNAEMRRRLLADLILANIGVITMGIFVSYFLARWTFKPVHEAMERQGRFVSDASHEFRTPLAALIMENEVLLRDPKIDKKELQAQVKSNLEEARKLEGLSARLLAMSLEEEIELSDVSAEEAARNAVERIKNAAEAKKIKVEVSVDKERMTGNLQALSDILTILLENAIKYSPEKSKIIIGAKNGNIFVQDEGPGISVEDLPYIFDRFYRAEKSRTSEGYGLGLSLAQDLAKRMKIKVVAENNKEQGSTFSITR